MGERRMLLQIESKDDRAFVVCGEGVRIGLLSCHILGISGDNTSRAEIIGVRCCARSGKRREGGSGWEVDLLQWLQDVKIEWTWTLVREIRLPGVSGSTIERVQDVCTSDVRRRQCGSTRARNSFVVLALWRLGLGAFGSKRYWDYMDASFTEARICCSLLGIRLHASKDTAGT
ncbi:hypothetical protein Tco_0085824 [Tanacetum coccineum]